MESWFCIWDEPDGSDNDKNDEQQKLLKQKKAENEAIKEI